jgi:type VI secretion system protein ImpI
MLSLTLVGGADRSAHTTMQMPQAQARLTIGRDPACDWALPDRTLALSARHCEIVRSPTGPVLRDLSTNGTFLNGATVRLPADHPLRDGDRFEAGPFTFQVAIDVQRAAAGPAAMEAPITSPAVHAPTPAASPRGRDPAAMAAAMPLPPMPAEEDLGLTRIRPAPAAASRPTPAPARVQAQPAAVVPPAPAAAAVEPTIVADWLPALARGLGLPPQALAGRDAVQLAEQLGRLTRISVEGMQKLLEQQSRTRRRIGSRKQAELKAASPLRLAGSIDEVLLALLAADPAAPVQQAVADLSRHHDDLLAAYRGAMQRLAEDLTPDALTSSLPGDDPARRWALYAALWQRLGLTVDDAPWTAGFVEAALLHLAAAYDQPA